MKKVSGLQVVTTADTSELPLHAEIQAALGELVGAARDGLLALSVGLGLRSRLGRWIGLVRLLELGQTGLYGAFVPR